MNSSVDLPFLVNCTALYPIFFVDSEKTFLLKDKNEIRLRNEECPCLLCDVELFFVEFFALGTTQDPRRDGN